MSDLFTVGHSNRGRDEFLQILFGWEIDALVDVRRYPESSRFPHFRATNLEENLPEEDVSYIRLGTKLGGYVEDRDLPVDPERIREWESEGFRQYAAYTETDEFQEGLERLEEIAREQTTAIMCAEGWYRKCHRQLIADQLKARGWTVRHIQSAGRTEEHEFQNVVRVEEDRVLYREQDE